MSHSLIDRLRNHADMLEPLDEDDINNDLDEVVADLRTAAVLLDFFVDCIRLKPGIQAVIEDSLKNRLRLLKEESRS